MRSLHTAILHVVHTTPYLIPEAGGPARSVPMLCDALADRGLTNDLLSIYLGARFSKSLLTQHNNNTTTLVPSRMSIRMTSMWAPSLQRRVNSTLCHTNPAIVHDHCPFVPIHQIAAYSAERHRIPLIVSTRGMLEPKSLSHHFLRKKFAWYLYQRNNLRKAAVLHATSVCEASNLIDMNLGVPVATIPNGVHLPPSTLYKRPEIMPSRRRIVLFLSRLLKQKGADKLIRAFARQPMDGWHLVIAGPDEGDQLQALKALTGQLRLTDKVSFAGAVEDADKWAFYKHADVFVLPTKTENFGNVIAEALAAGTPVITTKGAPWSVLSIHSCGWWIDDTQSALEQALSEAMSLRDDERSELGVRGRELIAARFTWEIAAAAMHELYVWVQACHSEYSLGLNGCVRSAQHAYPKPDFVQLPEQGNCVRSS